ncbi:MAG: NlpC/P60 family protein [Clostridium sp.]|jgi:peptidoglycan hydrolase CwlO-like protein
MKKKFISMVIIGVMTISSLLPIVSVSAAPQEVEDARNKYAAIEANIAEINEKIQTLDSEMAKLTNEMENNEKEIENLNDQIELTEKEIDKVKQDIADKEDILGERLREIYKSGGTTDYITLIFSAQSFGDLISKINAANKVVQLDQEMIEDVKNTKKSLDEKVASLDEKVSETEALNEEVKKQSKEVEENKAEQENLVAKAKEEQEKFDAEYLSVLELELVQAQIDVCYNSDSSYTDLDNAITNLRLVRDNQIKSPTVEEKINDAIEYAKPVKEEKKAEEERKKAEEAERQAQLQREEEERQAQVNRGNSSSSSSNSSSSNSNSNSSNSSSSSDSSSPSGVTTSGSAQAIVNEAYKHLGKAYVWGAKGPDNFDCSGFTSYVYQAVTGIWIGGDTYSQIYSGREVSYSELQPGDLVFPHSGHVGIYIGNGQMIHAPQTGDVVKVAPVYKFWRARRILN